MALFKQLTEENELRWQVWKMMPKSLRRFQLILQSRFKRVLSNLITIENRANIEYVTCGVRNQLLKTMTSQLLEASSVMHEVAE